MDDNSFKGFQERRIGPTLETDRTDRLESLCKEERERIRHVGGDAGVERIEARFRGTGFSPHRHDTYALGITLRGVQTFQYRGVSRASLPGQVIVLHPDELHDGAAGTETGLLYRMIYIPPEKIAEALGQGMVHGLPFVTEPVLSDPTFQGCLLDALSGIDETETSLKWDGLLGHLAECLARHSDDRSRVHRARRLLDWPALERCREFLTENHQIEVRSTELEALSGLDRFTLSRQFRSAYGTTPHRYQVMRRLDTVRQNIGRGVTLVEAAADAGFADQAHMTRHFRKTFGMTPGHWQALCAASEA